MAEKKPNPARFGLTENQVLALRILAYRGGQHWRAWIVEEYRWKIRHVGHLPPGTTTVSMPRIGDLLKERFYLDEPLLDELNAIQDKLVENKFRGLVFPPATPEQLHAAALAYEAARDDLRLHPPGHPHHRQADAIKRHAAARFFSLFEPETWYRHGDRLYRYRRIATRGWEVDEIDLKADCIEI